MSANLSIYLGGVIFNFSVAFLIVRLLYYPSSQNKQYILTFLAFSTLSYFVLGLLANAGLGVGVGFGLFAIFSILRYRTDTIATREMTYLFVLIALAVINSILISHYELAKILICNTLMVGILLVLEKEWGFSFEEMREITYDKIELATQGRREQLLADLKERTGLPIHRIVIGRSDFIRDTVELQVFYKKHNLVK